MSEQRGQKRSSQSRAERGSLKRARMSLNSPEMEDEEEDAGEYSDVDMSQVPTQEIQRYDAKSTIQLSSGSEAGVIERIELVDFMCHRKLDVRLSPNVNFILGRNGSGKSAIMTAIVVALGGKAVATHRGSSLKQFIRSGAKSTEVIVTLRNRGQEGFKWEEYGDKIVVQRTIRDDGAASYSIRGANGRIVSKLREELVLLLDHWNIQVDNPVSLLNQDTSRTFLHSNTPGDKYKLFMKATRLQQIYNDYEKSREEQQRMQNSIDREERRSEELKEAAKELEEKVELFRRLQEMEGKVNSLEMELQWVLVTEIESTIPPLEQKIERERARIPRNETKVQELKSKIEVCGSDLQRVAAELEVVVQEAETVNERRRAKSTEKRQLQREMREVEQKMRGLKTAIAAQAREKRALEQKMEDMIKMSQQDVAGKRERWKREEEELRSQLGSLQEELQEIGRKKRDAEEALDVLIDHQRQRKAHLSKLEQETEERGDRLRRLQASRADQLLAFGPWMRTLVHALEREGRQFMKPPKGPVGAMIKLRDYRWSVAIEAIIGKGILSSFIVDNTRDGATFKRVFARALGGGKRCADYITSKYTGSVYDVSRNRPRTRHPTVLDMVLIEDPDIVNILIDECQIDTILLIERRTDAEQVIEVERPPKANVAYTIEGDQILRSRFYANKKQPLGFIKESVDKAIQEEQIALDHLCRQKDEVEVTGRELNGKAMANKREQGRIRNHMSAKQSDMYQVQMRINELKSIEEEESQEDIATYETEIQECDNKIKVTTEKKSIRESRKAELQSSLLSCEEDLTAMEADAETVARKMEDIRSQHAEFEREKQKAESVIKHYQGRVRAIQDSIADKQRELKEAQQRAQQAASAASDVCERIESSRGHKSIEMEVRKLQRLIQQEEPHTAEKEAIQREYVTTVENFKKVKKSVLELKKALKELQKGLALRLTRYEMFQDTIAYRTAIYFRHFLQERGYDGELKFNHNEQNLSMNVKVDPHMQGTKNTKSLSGGERSFTTVCYIMSLWEAIEAPFRCLDEFDVFMDMINRRISMRMMLQFAKEQERKQFIFFTPQDMSQMGVEMNEQVRVQRLRSPDRQQTTLD